MNLSLKTALYLQLARGANAQYWVGHYRDMAMGAGIADGIAYNAQEIIYKYKFVSAQEAFFALIDGAAAYAPEEEGLSRIDKEALWKRGLEEAQKRCSIAALTVALEALCIEQEGQGDD